ncbi:esterase-like activity of phytase family protein [Microvirga aerophila]|uniref:Phytase-like domain-containing protein n=1 Tax=Microvirga aerophila TaxID=670291 RepID=A0A512BKY0_9HYPH|nr:esterase-like activity of phytase family protein [Microvirga aerophila]GEO12583.1 hypothetical protein MAE02_02790 [Microvirga aerophila]
MRLSRRSLLIGGGALAATAVASRALSRRPQALEQPTAMAIEAVPIDRLSAADPDRSRFGALLFRSGLDLRSTDKRFGGFSALWRSRDGRDLVAVADNSQWLKARVETADGRLSGLSGTVLAPLLLDGGKPLRRSRFYDTESLTASGGAAFMGVERSHGVIRFDRHRDGSLGEGAPIAVPEELSGLPGNRGLEAIGIAPARSPLAGSLVAVAERSGWFDDTPTKGFILTGSQAGTFEVVRTAGYDISDLAFLPSGEMLLLERRFSVLDWLRIRLRRIARTAIRPGALVDGDVIFESDASQQIDNMEGLAVHREAGETILTMISDNNFNWFQRTLLLEFALAG